MLVRNLTQAELIVKGITGKKITLPSLKVVDIDGLEFPAERLKKHFGRYIHILTEKEKVADDLSTETKEDLESKKDNNNVQTVDETSAKEEVGEGAGNEGDNKDVDIENVDNDTDNLDELVNSVLEEIEDGTTDKEEKPAKTAKKTGKKANKNK